MKISKKDWLAYINRLSLLDRTAADKMRAYVDLHGVEDTDALVDYAYGIATKYGEGSGALAAEMYDLIAELSGKNLPPAEPAPTPEYGEVAKTVYGTMKNTDVMSDAIGRLVKRTGVDTTVNNAIRDGAYLAWIPNGDTCAFCITLASRGWQKASKKLLKNGHAEHIHAHCDCTHAVSFDGDGTKYGDYDPDKYLEMYENASDGSSQDKINALRRQKYQENKDRINAQKREAYEKQRLNEKENDDKIKYEKSVLIPGNAGAMFKNTLITLPDGTESRLTPHSRIEKVQIIAGKGRERQIDTVDILTGKYKDTAESPELWQKLKGIGYVDYDGESYKADIHWYRHPKTGDVEHRIKPDPAGNWFYED